MSGKPRLLLLDAGAVFAALCFDARSSLVSAYEVIVPSIVVRVEAIFYVDRTGDRVAAQRDCHIRCARPEVAEDKAWEQGQDRSLSVARAIYLHLPDGYKQAAEVNPSTVSRAVKALAQEGLVEFERRGRSSATWMQEPERLLQSWTPAYDWSRNERLAFNAPVGAPEKFLPRLKRVFHGTRWALSLHAGASLIAPHATWNRVHLYYAGTERQLLDLVREAGWKLGEEGNLVVMWPLYKESVWWRLERRQTLPVVSVLQLVLDLWQYPLRGREQAEHLLKSKLAPVWRG